MNDNTTQSQWKQAIQVALAEKASEDEKAKHAEAERKAAELAEKADEAVSILSKVFGIPIPHSDTLTWVFDGYEFSFFNKNYRRYETGFLYISKPVPGADESLLDDAQLHDIESYKLRIGRKMPVDTRADHLIKEARITLGNLLKEIDAEVKQAVLANTRAIQQLNTIRAGEIATATEAAPPKLVIEMRRVIGVSECARLRNEGWHIVHSQFVPSMADVVPYFVLERTVEAPMTEPEKREAVVIETLPDMSSRVLLHSDKPHDNGAFHRAIDLARQMKEAGLWDGKCYIRFADAYTTHGLVMGVQKMPLTDLVIQIMTAPDGSAGIEVSLPAEKQPMIMVLEPTTPEAQAWLDGKALPDNMTLLVDDEQGKASALDEFLKAHPISKAIHEYGADAVKDAMNAQVLAVIGSMPKSNPQPWAQLGGGAS